MDEFCDAPAEPVEKADTRHALYHDHHAAEEQDRRPVDAAGFGFRTGRAPEFRREDRGKIDHMPHRLQILHADAEHRDQCQCSAAEGNVVLLDLIHDDENEHRHKNDDRYNLRCHVIDSFQMYAAAHLT